MNVMRLFCFWLLLSACGLAQPYLTGPYKSRQRFAQTVFGVDLQASVGGRSQLINASSTCQAFYFKPQFNPRIYISGTHFWGHAEFYFAFQLPALVKNNYMGIYYTSSQSDIFGTKIYPWAIRKKKIRPYIGLSISGLTYHQYSAGLDGPFKTRLKAPLLAGINYCGGKYLFELGLSYHYDPVLHYYISPGISTTVHLPQLLVSLGIRRWFETTAAAEKDYLNGNTEARYKALKQQKRLSSWFAGLGPSSAFYTQGFSSNRDLFPFMDKPFSTIFPELSLGYFYEPAGLHVCLAARRNAASITGYGITQTFKRSSLSLESYVYLFDYKGFTPFAGACLSYEWLGFSQRSDTASNFSVHKQQVTPGIIFGWDILPDKLQGITLRTNLRYFPNLQLQPVPGKSVNLSQLEFNFIQLIVYPQRIRNIRKPDAST